MTEPISTITPFPNIAQIDPAEVHLLGDRGALQLRTPDVSFQDVLLKTIDQVGASDERTQKMIEDGLAGGDINQAEIFISMKKTDLAYRTLIQIRNQALDAYNELQQMRM